MKKPKLPPDTMGEVPTNADTTEQVRGFFDRTCRSCRKKYGWNGTIKDVPPNCPKCGEPLSDKEKADLEQDEKLMEEFRKELLKDK
jgi:predicted amidophosphoribosyltransferase